MLITKSQKIAAVLGIVYVILSLALISVFEHKDDPHSIYGLCGTIVLGFSFIIFRVLRGVSTKMVKYIHFSFTLMASILLVISLLSAGNTKKLDEYDDIHIIPGYITCASIAIQVITAIFLFTYVYQRRQGRHCFAPFHDIFGIWIYICLVGCILGGNFSIDPIVRLKKTDCSDVTKMFNYLSYINFLIIIVVTLSPYFEWELVGDL